MGNDGTENHINLLLFQKMLLFYVILRNENYTISSGNRKALFLSASSSAKNNANKLVCFKNVVLSMLISL